MMKVKFARRLLFALMGAVATAVVTTSITLSWFLGPNAFVDKVIDGEVGLRGYFFTGNGTPEHPYEIVNSTHFYNLTRLQNLGIFPEKTYFQIGHVFEGDTDPKCINDDGHGGVTYDDYLDMYDLSHSSVVLPIGSEATPFVGTFNGNGIPIKHLKVTGYPEDIGVFGYVSYEGSVTGLVCDDLEIHSMGYNSTAPDPDNLLFSADIDDIFTSAHYLATDTNFTIYKKTGGTFVGTNLKRHNTLLVDTITVNGTSLNNINNTDNRIGEVYNQAYFAPVFPNVANDPFTYSWISSTSLLQEVEAFDVDGDGVNDKVLGINMSALKNSEDFNSGGDMEADSRLYLVASVAVDGYTFSRVIQSYEIDFFSNGDIYAGEGSQGRFSASIFCDYVNTGTVGDYNTNYHHGNNIGFLAGHVDGTMDECFVYNGKLTFNQTGYNPILTETDTGLIGELGKNVVNSIDPEIGLTTNGDIGIMNFTRIYELIRSDMEVGEGDYVLACGQQMPDGSNTPVNYVSYDPFINEDHFSDFSKYLRHDNPAGQYHYIIGTSTDMSGYSGNYALDSASKIKSDFNKVDFLWNQVIEDEDNVDRGLGVFKIISASLPGANESNYGTYMLNKMGSSVIVNGEAKRKVYFSTAEFDHSKSTGGAWASDTPLRALHLPTYSDINSFKYPFSRDYNYVFELNLEDMVKAGSNNYMYNTDSEFLKNYLTSVLRDKYGGQIPWMNPRFGFMFLNDQNVRLDSLSSYMPISKPGGDDRSGKILHTDGKYYPSQSVSFHISNTNGANVSVVGSNADITIYKVDTTGAKNPVALKTMRSSNISSSDMNRYFTYDVEYGYTGTEAVKAATQSQMDSDGGALYGHIFYLPEGDYCIGSEGNARLYFLAVQGQNDATIGDKTIANMGNTVEHCDFLTEAPEFNDFSSDLALANISFRANFNDKYGTTFYVKTKEVSAVDYLWLDFEDGEEDRFVTYLVTYSSTKNPLYILETRYADVNVLYRTT